ncbi:putative cyclase-domain-containing protein [Aspergillus pseudoustus]|uniref:Cyclase-domain-containing protein n=1 Tax=Aspergillus pseudoustus TaxID=1810923 RepID=A0ABR4K2N8_9EURO
MSSTPLAVPMPAFEDLPLRPGDPHHSAWGLWKNPALGSLNHLTDEVVLRAAREEIRSGERVTVNLPLDTIKPALLGRIDFQQKLINKAPRVINDDVITFNTQTSTQWDSFRHFAYQEEKKFYNGVTQDEIHNTPNSTINGLDGWSEKAIAGRGVLVDYASWAAEQQQQREEERGLTARGITVSEIETILAQSKVTLRTGDILFVRTGYLPAYTGLDAAGREKLTVSPHAWPGLEQSKEMVRWLWERQFAGVAADNPGLECVPPVNETWQLHPILLAGWGTPIGELFDLEALAATCKREQRWTFFVTSVPLNYRGAVASPPNGLAIF